MKILASVLLALLVSGAGFWLGALDFSGLVVASAVGAAVFWGAGLPGATVLIFFFVAGSALSRLPTDVSFPEQKARRDWRQVLANGLWPALLTLAYGFRQEEVYYLAFVAAVATACADTASGEVGVRWGKKTVSILNFRSVPHGVSGGVSLVGSLAGLLAAFLVALVGTGPRGWGAALSLKSAAIITTIGFLGMLFDSFLGAVAQVKYRCRVCRSAVEVSKHCGQPAEKISGFVVLDNDGVNLFATLFGGLVGLVWF